MKVKTTKTYSCSTPYCTNTITAIGPTRTHEANLRRVDWKLEGGKATCRQCS